MKKNNLKYVRIKCTINKHDDDLTTTINISEIIFFFPSIQRGPLLKNKISDNQKKIDNVDEFTIETRIICIRANYNILISN